MGLPGMCGFVGEFMVVLATWNFSKVVRRSWPPLTVVLTAAYILWTMQRVYLGTNPAYKDYPDINLRELALRRAAGGAGGAAGRVARTCCCSWMEPSVTGLVDSLAATDAVRPLRRSAICEASLDAIRMFMTADTHRTLQTSLLRDCRWRSCRS